jgi:hypothetical protein
MLVQLEFQCGNLKVEALELNQTTVILCETPELVELWKEILLNIPKDEINLGFTDFEDEQGFYEIDKEWKTFLSKLVVKEEDDNCIMIFYPNRDMQQFFISTDVNVVYNCNTYWDLWFCKDDDFYESKFYALCEFIGIEEKYKDNFDKKDLIRDIKCGRFGFDVYDERN